MATPEQLRQRIGLVSLARFLALAPPEQAAHLASWRADATPRLNHCGPLVRLDARQRLQRCDEWAAAAGLSHAPAAPTDA